ncbi:hypothetical protein SAMN02746065_11022 [Desulfocicer vacuolatum DSM 3385]|uniref:PIN domain-containing protein n=1 Tax=Desulfocicer vacuolatum DSM 3385 TaxID=1121400 RepID=A0A1W2BZ05_9BACT|nr:hypothetical protein [Desulfocicer vacuolatum]SMC78227.1 hypothetical protein SAMN02746065_11022 [Desulfocicer vacuolatum DSM 3385]
MIVLVNDANIFIDLLKIDLIDLFFKLPCEFHVTDLVLAEIHEANVAKLVVYIDDGTLHKKTFTFEELMQIQSLESKYKALSVPDCSCLFQAKILSGRLLTGDAPLRKYASKDKIPVHGILWIFDQLLEHNIITPHHAHDKLTDLINRNARLPKAECRKRLNKWK